MQRVRTEPCEGLSSLACNGATAVVNCIESKEANKTLLAPANGAQTAWKKIEVVYCNFMKICSIFHFQLVSPRDEKMVLCICLTMTASSQENN